jgi:hypothetical protein
VVDGETLSAEVGPSPVTLGDYLSPAWQKVTSLKSGAFARRRSKFAPSGRGSRAGLGFGSVPPPRSGPVPREGVAAQIDLVRVPRVAPQGAAAAPSPLPVSSPGAAVSPAAAVAGACADGVPPAKPVGPACQSPVRVAAVSGVGAASASGPGPTEALLPQKDSVSASKPNSPVFFSRVKGVVYKWLWVPAETLDLRSASPASLLDIQQWMRRTSSSLSSPRLLRPSPMDRSREATRVGSKRSYEEYDSDAGRWLESQLRGRLEHSELHRQRERGDERDWDRRRSPEWRRGEERRREDERRPATGPSYSTEQFSRKKVGVRKFSARSRAAAGAPTPTPPPQAPSARPPPSAVHSSH